MLWRVFDDTLRLSEVAVSQLTDKEKAKVEKFRNLLSVKKQKEDLITGETREVTEDGPILVAYKLKFLDLDDQLGVGELLLQAGILAGQAGNLVGERVAWRRFWARRYCCQGRIARLEALAPLGQRRNNDCDHSR
jgi:hypothetical protein